MRCKEVGHSAPSARVSFAIRQLSMNQLRTIRNGEIATDSDGIDARHAASSKRWAGQDA